MSSTSAVIQTNTRAGLCPHGLPPSACPICGSKTMSGSGKMRDNAPLKQTHSGEWSFMKCYAAGMAIKAQQIRAENAKNVFEKQIEFAQKLGENIQNLADKIKSVFENINKTMPENLKPASQFVLSNVVNPILNLFSQIPKIVEKSIILEKNFAGLLSNAVDKLTAILADMKSFIDKKIVDDLKRKVKNFFLFFISNLEDENYKNDDTLAVFKSRELKKIVSKIIRLGKKRNNHAN